MGDEIAISIVGGIITAASVNGYTNDPCDGSEMIDLEHKEEHYTREGKPYDDKSEVKQLLEDGIDKAFEVIDGGKRYYIKEVGPDQWTMIVLPVVTSGLAEQMLHGFADRLVKTFLTDTDDGEQFFDSREEAVDAIPEEVKEIDC